MTAETHAIKTPSGLTLWSQKCSRPKSRAGTLLLVAGAGASAMFWSDSFCQHFLTEGYEIIRYDHRDIGLSNAVDWQENPYTVADLAADAMALLDAYDIEHAHVVGHSMGGTIAQWLAIHYPHRLKSFTSISVATAAGIKPPSKTTMNALLANQPTQNYAVDLPGFMKVWTLLNGEYPVDSNLAEAYTKDLYQRSQYPVAPAWNHIHCQESFDISDQLHKISVPGLFIHGNKDPLIAVEDAIKTQHQVPKSQMLVLAGMGHMFFDLHLEKSIATAILSRYEKIKACPDKHC